jgi:hypothetical protein
MKQLLILTLALTTKFNLFNCLNSTRIADFNKNNNNINYSDERTSNFSKIFNF